MSSCQILSAFAAMGLAFSTGQTADDAFVCESWATLVLHSILSDNSEVLSLWVGMETSNGDLVQGFAENHSSDNWNVYAYTLMSTSGPFTRSPVESLMEDSEEAQLLTTIFRLATSQMLV